MTVNISNVDTLHNAKNLQAIIHLFINGIFQCIIEKLDPKPEAWRGGRWNRKKRKNIVYLAFKRKAK